LALFAMDEHRYFCGMMLAAFFVIVMLIITIPVPALILSLALLNQLLLP